MSNRDEEFTEIGNIPLSFHDIFPRVRVCYIILTCEKYIPTRVRWQKETCFRNSDLKDCYFLSCKNGEKSVYGWNTADDYPSCITKYIKFFQNMDLDYDWYMFIDDDTFVFPNRVEQFLARLDPSDPLYVGNAWSHIAGLRFMSGGAGFFLTKSAYTMLRQFLKDDVNAALRTSHALLNGDATMGVWIREINRTSGYPIKLLSDWKYLNIGGSENLNHILSSVTFHYVNTLELFKKYDKYLSETDRALAMPKKCTSLPRYDSIITFTHPVDSSYALRHAYYRISVCKNTEDNDDFLFRVKAARNGNPNGFSFQSVNYPEYYISTKDNGIIIAKDNSLDDQSWILEGSTHIQMYSLSTGSKKFLTLGPNNSVCLTTTVAQAQLVLYEIPCCLCPDIDIR